MFVSPELQTQDSQEDYTKENLLGGVTCIPFKSLGRNNTFTLSVDALAGIGSVTSKNNQTKNTSTNLAGELGINGIYNITKHIGIEAGAGWNPVFSKGVTSSNYRTRLGINFNF